MFVEELPLLNKAISQEEKDRFADLTEKMIKLDLGIMGFTKEMIEELLKNEVIQDTNHAVELLIKGPLGWTHKYVKVSVT